MKNTKIEYMYRDASNYKFYGEFIVYSKLSLTDIQPYLFDAEFFVPHKVDLQHLLNLPINDDDHYLHSFVSFNDTTNSQVICTAGEMIRKFKDAYETGWFS
jgi:hypothetical protein